jgi:tetraacyldisaccharide 4'-kinase
LEPGVGHEIVIEHAEDPFKAGDEPTMMASAYRQRVGVGKNRYEVAEKILQGLKVDIFLLDDGFQHRQLRRDLDLLLLGWDWDGWVVPAGPFREPRIALRRADVYLVTGSQDRWEAVLAKARRPSFFFGSLRPRGLLTREGNRWTEIPLSTVSGAKILAVSAIANSGPFYRMIQEWGGEIVDTVEFSDHHRYTNRDWQRITSAARHVERIVTTEKDIVKLVRFPFANGRLLALRVSMVVEMGDSLIQTVEQVIRERSRGVNNLGAPSYG